MPNFMYNTQMHLLQDFNQIWLLLQQLKRYTAALSDKGSSSEHCWGFTDGIVRSACHPENNQPVLYNGYKRVHGITFQSIAAPNGMIGDLCGHAVGKSHEIEMLTMSGLLPQVQ